jgi:hypothetical protein
MFMLSFRVISVLSIFNIILTYALMRFSKYSLSIL